MTYSLRLFLFFLMASSLLSCAEHHDENYIVIENEILQVQINPNGAELMSIFSKAESKEYLWHGDSAYWSARAPIMFPVNVRFKDERFSYKGKEYQMPRMGLAVNASFEVLEKDSADEAILILNSSKDINENNYPFPFQFQVRYTLKDNQVINEYSVKNMGEDTMYFALGGHPGFVCDFSDGKERNDYQISFFNNITIGRNLIDNSLFHDTVYSFLENESVLNLSDERIPMGGMFLKNSNIRHFGVGYSNQQPYVTLHLNDFPNVNIWTPPGMPFVCIEPMASHHDRVDSPLDISLKNHLIALPPNTTNSYSYSIEVSV